MWVCVIIPTYSFLLVSILILFIQESWPLMSMKLLGVVILDPGQCGRCAGSWDATRPRRGTRMNSFAAAWIQGPTQRVDWLFYPYFTYILHVQERFIPGKIGRISSIRRPQYHNMEAENISWWRPNEGLPNMLICWSVLYTSISCPIARLC